jgi:YegS C-terminal NAD kinase beta sandwich-like domain
MTIRKGEAWGAPAVIPSDVVVVRNNLELHHLLTDGPPKHPIGPLGGDLATTLGVRDTALVPGEPGTEMPIDLIRVTADGRVGWAAMHVIVRGSWWHGPIWAAMNAQFAGRWDVAPRSHPNDGRFDLVAAAVDLSRADRWKARRRLPLGTHVPHPHIDVRQHSAVTIDVPDNHRIALDGSHWGRGPMRLELSLMPDAATVIVASDNAP